MTATNDIFPSQDINAITTTYYGLDIKDFNVKYGHKETNKSKFSPLDFVCSLFRSVSFSQEALEKRIPAIGVVRQYKFRQDILGDVVSGLSVGVMTIPQSMGYSILAAVPGHYGLYTSLFPVLVYFIFGTSRHVSIGTMALSSLIIRSAVEHAKLSGEDFKNITGNDTHGSSHFEHPHSVHVAVSVSLTAGLILLVMSCLRLGFVVTYMSDSFISGYLAASNILVLTHQIKLILGVKTSPHAGPLEFFYLAFEIFKEIPNTNLMQLLLSTVTIACLVLVKLCVNERFKSRMKIPIPIDLLIVVLATIVCHFGRLESNYHVKVLKDIPQGIPAPLVPSPVLMYRYLFEGFMLAIVSYMMVAMMGTLFAQRHQYQVDNNQEMVANGLACVVGSFLNSLASSTSPPRCFLMESTGGRTQVSFLVSACLILVTLIAIAPLFYSLPICVLASVVIVACIPLFTHYTMWLTYWKNDRYDFAIWVVTFFMTFLAGVDYGLVIGVGFSLVLVHYRMQHSKSTRLQFSSDGNRILLDTDSYSEVCSLNDDVYIFQFSGPVYFATSSMFRRRLLSAAIAIQSSTAQVVDEALELLPTPVVDNITNNTFTSGESTLHESTLQSSAEVHGEENGPGRWDNNDDDLAKPLQGSEKMVSRKLSGESYVVVDCCGIPFIDSGGARLIAQLHGELRSRNVALVLAGCTLEVLSQLQRVAQCDAMLKSSVYPSVHDALIGLRRRSSP